MMKARAALFDLDDTLAESFKQPKPEMIDRLIKVLEHIPVAIVTGRGLDRMKEDFMKIVQESSHTDRFFLFPEGGAQGLQWSAGSWSELYTNELPDDERVVIKKAIADAVAETGVLEGLPVFGEQYMDKHAMIAFAALGIEVPTDLKYSWDPLNARRAALSEAIAHKLPNYEVLMGGATSIDVTKKGVNKAHAVVWLSERLAIPTADMLYVGDALFPDGNDFVVIPTGVHALSTTGPTETTRIIDELLAELSA